MTLTVLAVNGVQLHQRALGDYRLCAKKSTCSDWLLHQLVAALRQEGVSAGELLAANYTGQELWNGGFTHSQIKAANAREEQAVAVRCLPYVSDGEQLR